MRGVLAEKDMFTLVLLLLLLWFVLGALLLFWTLWCQTYLYTQPAEGTIWRAPAAGAAVTLIVLIWVIMDYRSPGNYRPFWESVSSEDSKPFPELRVGKEVYKLQPGTRQYSLGGTKSGKPLPSRPSEVVVVEGDVTSTFKPERDEKGNFKQRVTRQFGQESKEALRYIDEKGRVMVEGGFGVLSGFRGSWLFGTLFLNALLLAVWFLTFWLILEFQLWHGLIQAVICWGMMLLFVLPPLLTKAEEVAKQRAQAQPQTMLVIPFRESAING
jgi:hypothetical protein